MSLRNLLNSRPETPYFRPPPLHIFMLKIQDQERVISWNFSDGSAKPSVTKKNKVAVITDGQTVTKITIFEEFSSKVQQGVSYMMRGHGLSGTAPPYFINVTAQTQFFRGPALNATEELYTNAELLLNPPAPLTPLTMSLTKGGLITVQGEVMELSAMKKVLSGKVHVPLRNLQLKEDSCVVTLCLWREAAIQQFSVGDHINVSHMKLSQSSYGPQLQSTSFSKVERKEEEMSEVHLIGVDTCDTPNQLEVLLENGSTLFIAGNLWKPFEEQILKAKLTVAIKVKGKHIIEITQK